MHDTEITLMMLLLAAWCIRYKQNVLALGLVLLTIGLNM